MGHQVFEWVIAIAVLIVFISNVVFLWVIYKMLKPLIAKLEATGDKLDPILNEVPGVLDSAKGMIGAVTHIIVEAQPSVRNVATKTSDMADMVHGQVIEINTLMRDTVLPTVRTQVERVDELVRRTSDKIDATAVTVQKEVIEPIATKTNNITDLAHAQVIELSGLMQDTILRVRNQVEQLDDLLRRTTDKIDTTTTTIQRHVTEPIREFNHIGVAARRVLSALFGKDKNNRGKKEVD